MHRLKSLLTRPAAVVVAVLAIGGATGGYALAASSFTPMGCVQPDAALGGRVLANPYTTQSGWNAFLAKNGGKCPDGGFAMPVGGGTGQPGQPGAGVLNGATVPTAATVGTQAGAFYIDTTTNDVYGPYLASDTTNGGWGTPVSMVGKSVTVTTVPVGNTNCPYGGDKSVDDITTYICNGAPGTAGTAGTNGTNGQNGTNGTNGVNGQSPVVTQLASGNTNCPNGGVSITDPTSSKASYVCSGANGTNGTSAQLSVSASTLFSAWPETSGWADDTFTRDGTLTRVSEVPANDCGSSATSCYLYDLTFGDNGTFTTVDGTASPNGTSAKIEGAWTGTLVGSGKEQFYASNATPSASTVPTKITGAQKGTDGSTGYPLDNTSWYQQFFPANTQFGSVPAQVAGYGPWMTYDWAYTVSVPCGSSNVSQQAWNDAINPGDDGQSAGDGNVTGSTACTS